MARRKPAPETSRISRTTTVAYARKQKPASSEEASEASETGDASETPASAPAAQVEAAAQNAAATAAIVEAKAELASTAPASDAPATPRAQADTVSMPVVAPVGAPPAIPAAAPATDASGELLAEAPTVMPEPPDVPPGEPSDRCAPPGLVPAGDSRSLRKRAERYEFALIYRRGTFIVTRTGEVGTRGVWRVVEYPTASAAGHAYAKQSSAFVSEGFSDYRD